MTDLSFLHTNTGIFQDKASSFVLSLFIHKQIMFWVTENRMETQAEVKMFRNSVGACFWQKASKMTEVVVTFAVYSCTAFVTKVITSLTP